MNRQITEYMSYRNVDVAVPKNKKLPKGLNKDGTNMAIRETIRAGASYHCSSTK
jgi:hypothetical protein